eukprot:CAMPEP_0197837798 /NCGR_PEP_ID=MMETSP1437-20131217/33347_1 /TAXON_ID=49252 ORGANISM="Eucampia antarctica, Strain CCMP1452" /NCGR_SAMPLE_ID=MMETSP1437 /ASSEMBLY_ACC=CAM_ASM_001096 /LENGTH=124 /DNA_ID=CAMNT_0043445141 /DNA_START=242 /DNA_END=616 /DNA_ORIENTATION=+
MNLNRIIEQPTSISVNELLRERFIDPIIRLKNLKEKTTTNDKDMIELNKSILSSTPISGENLKSQSEAVMESLCLDASMLLLTPHGMAMHLSPCQIEAVETVLMNQLDAVQNAKTIQSRLHSEN